jgi:23S rRNA pseudouridine1911/1915/1917 synthase
LQPAVASASIIAARSARHPIRFIACDIVEVIAANYSRRLEADPAAETADAPGDRRFVIDAAYAGWRLDRALAQLMPEHSRSRIKGWIDAGRVTIDGVRAEPARHLATGECVIVQPIEAPAATRDAAEPLALAIVHEDDALIVVDKPAGLVVHPGSGNRAGTLMNGLLHHAPSLARVPRAGIVHRLDKDTSGLMVVAKTPVAQTDLVRQLAARTVEREYLAIVRGDLDRPVIVDAPIGRHPIRRTEMAVVDTGKEARTRVSVIERFGAATLVRCRLDTGRTHQIRVHLAAIEHPLLGDPTYGTRKSGLPPFARQALHAARLSLLHPTTGRKVEWRAPPPADFQQLLARLRASQSTAIR